jgi:hypothetical protein
VLTLLGDSAAEAQAAMIDLALETIAQAHTLLARGSPAMKMQVLRILLPAMARALTPKEEEEDQFAAVRQEMTALLGAVRDG